MNKTDTPCDAVLATIRRMAAADAVKLRPVTAIEATGYVLALAKSDRVDIDCLRKCVEAIPVRWLHAVASELWEYRCVAAAGKAHDRLYGAVIVEDHGKYSYGVRDYIDFMIPVFDEAFRRHGWPIPQRDPNMLIDRQRRKRSIETFAATLAAGESGLDAVATLLLKKLRIAPVKVRTFETFLPESRELWVFGQAGARVLTQDPEFVEFKGGFGDGWMLTSGLIYTQSSLRSLQTALEKWPPKPLHVGAGIDGGRQCEDGSYAFFMMAYGPLDGTESTREAIVARADDYLHHIPQWRSGRDVGAAAAVALMCEEPPDSGLECLLEETRQRFADADVRFDILIGPFTLEQIYGKKSGRGLPPTR